MSVVTKLRSLATRIVAVFIASGLSVIGAGAVAGISVFKAVIIAGIGGVATVLEGLAKAYIKDGDLSDSDINTVFASHADSGSEPVAEEPTA